MDWVICSLGQDIQIIEKELNIQLTERIGHLNGLDILVKEETEYSNQNELDILLIERT